MTTNKNKARIILIGCGPHARRIYLPALARLDHIEVALIVDLKSEESTIRPLIPDFCTADLWFIEPFTDTMPAPLAKRLSAFITEHDIEGVIIATEPMAHRAYAEWALDHSLNILIDKPITTRAEVVSSLSSAEGIFEDYHSLLTRYQKLQEKKETIFIVNSQRRFHKGFQFVKDQIRSVAAKTNCPVTFIQAYHCDGQWRLPAEIVKQQYHSYNTGYGKASHSGYHIFDTVYQLYAAAGTVDKFADTMEVESSFIQPNGLLSQFNESDYDHLFGADYKGVKQWSDKELRELCKNYGEVDLSSIITLKKDGDPIANFTINLLHNGFSGRTWINPGQDLYKGNGRIKHESYHIQQGPFQNIQVHTYQGYDKHDHQHAGHEDQLGGKNHFDIYVFQNPMIAGNAIQPQVYKISDIDDGNAIKTNSSMDMEKAKYKVVNDFADYLTGRKDKSAVLSQLDDHVVPVQIMSGIYRSNILRKNNLNNIIRYSFGDVGSDTRAEELVFMPLSGIQ